MEDVIQQMFSQTKLRPALEERTLPDLRASIKELLQQIVLNRELDRHWQTKEREN